MPSSSAATDSQAEVYEALGVAAGARFCRG